LRSGFTRTLLLSASLGLALRLAFALGYWADQPLTRDEREYLALARGLASGQGFTSDAWYLANQPEPFGRAPGYPLFLALVGGGRATTTAVPMSVKIAQALAGAAGVVALGFVARRLGGPRAGVAAGVIAACYPPLIWISAYAFSEALAWPIGIALVLAFDAAAGRVPGSRHPPSLSGRGERMGRSSAGGLLLLTAVGALAGAAILIRPAMLFFSGLTMAWLIRRRGLAMAMAFTAGSLVVVAPWTIRNIRQEGRFVLVASEGGVTFWTGNHPDAIGDGDLAANPRLKRENLALRAQHPNLSESQMEPVYYHEALAWIAAHPWRWLALESRKIFYLVVPVGPSYRLHSARYYAGSVISYGLLLPAAVVGFWRMGRRRSQSPGLWLLLASAVLVSLVFFPQERFRIPVIDPVLIVCAAALFSDRESA